MWVNSSTSGLDSTRIRATELPTVPKPKRAMRSGRCARKSSADGAEACRGDGEGLCSGTGISSRSANQLGITRYYMRRFLPGVCRLFKQQDYHENPWTEYLKNSTSRIRSE